MDYNNMKKYALMICAGMLISLPGAAQELRMGAMAGMNVNVPSDLKTGIGFKVGAMGKLTLPTVAKGLYTDFGVALSSLPWKTERIWEPASNTTHESKANPYYLNIPVHVGYQWKCGSQMKLFAGVGPYLNVGLFGKINTTATNGTIQTEKKQKVSLNYFSDDEMNRVDWGVGLNAGIELARHYQVALGYDWGMSDIMSSDNYDYRNRTFTLTLGYLF